MHLHSHLVESKSGKAPKHDFAVLLHVQEQVLGSRIGVAGDVTAHIASVLSQKQEQVFLSKNGVEGPLLVLEVVSISLEK